jgi:hypothetical protein
MSDTERMILSALQSWSQVIARLDQRLLNLTDEQLERQVSPERVGKLATGGLRSTCRHISLKILASLKS